MSAGLSPQQFNAMARRRLQAMAKEVGGIYCRGQVLCPDGIRLQFRRINASNGEAAGILQAVNGKVVEGLPVQEMIEKAKVA